MRAKILLYIGILFILALLYGYAEYVYENPMLKDAEKMCKYRTMMADSNDQFRIKKGEALSRALLLDYLEKDEYWEFMALVNELSYNTTNSNPRQSLGFAE